MAARVTLLAILAAIFLVLNLPSAYTKPVQDLSSRRPEIDGLHHHLGEGKRGAVASESAICSRIGTDMLKMGGNAADAVSRLLRSLKELSWLLTGEINRKKYIVGRDGVLRGRNR